jgi:lipoprotein-anchoring transpeptidase ErfK/SrfK
MLANLGQFHAATYPPLPEDPMNRSFRLAVLAGLGLLAAATSASAYEIDPLTRMPLMQNADPAKAQATAIPREIVDYPTKQRPGTIVIDSGARRLYYVLPDGKAMRYGVGVGRPGFDWAGSQSITRKAEWPTWTPPAQMLKRRPDLPRFMPGGPENPMGARAMYLGSTLYRIHGSNEPETIGQAVSSGCIRMLNEDVIDLYERVKVGTRVVVAR